MRLGITEASRKEGTIQSYFAAIDPRHGILFNIPLLAFYLANLLELAGSS